MKRSEREQCGVDGCTGSIVVIHSRPTLHHRVQYLGCNKCGAKHGRRDAPSELAVKVAELEARLKNLEQSFAQYDTIVQPED